MEFTRESIEAAFERALADELPRVAALLSLALGAWERGQLARALELVQRAEEVRKATKPRS